MKRKRLQLLLVLLMTAATGAWAQQTLTVYDGTDRETTSPAGFAYCDDYVRSQTIIPSTALTAMKGCDITAMKFYQGYGYPFTTQCSFDVYLKEVSYSAFTDPYTFEPQRSCTTVYQGTLSVVDGTLTLTVTFSKPFHYKGGNLLIGTENTSKNSYYPYVEFNGTNTGSSLSNISIHHKTDLALASATSIMKGYFIPKTTFTYVVPTYSVKLADGTQDAANWTITSGENSATGDAADGLTGLKEGDAVTLTYGGRLKVKAVTATTDAEPDPLATPLTVEALTAGTIVVNIDGTLTKGMKYSVNGGTTKTPITLTTGITVAKGDKVQFYGNGTDIQAYYIQNEVSVSINGSGNGFQTKVYGNIMSLLDEEGFATNTELPNDYVFMGLFNTNLSLSDASELLLPATELTPYCYSYMFEGCNNLTTAPKLPATTLATRCYEAMFMNCTSLTTAPKLPATTLASKCYRGMFFLCSSLTTAYVKAAFTVSDGECDRMFEGCTATGAVLHTTSDNKASWEAKMGTGKSWPTWSVAGDWQD